MRGWWTNLVTLNGLTRLIDVSKIHVVPVSQVQVRDNTCLWVHIPLLFMISTSKRATKADKHLPNRSSGPLALSDRCSSAMMASKGRTISRAVQPHSLHHHRSKWTPCSKESGKHYMKMAKMLQRPLEQICFVAETNLWCLPVCSEIPTSKDLASWRMAKFHTKYSTAWDPLEGYSYCVKTVDKIDILDFWCSASWYDIFNSQRKFSWETSDIRTRSQSKSIVE